MQIYYGVKKGQGNQEQGFIKIMALLCAGVFEKSDHCLRFFLACHLTFLPFLKLL